MAKGSGLEGGDEVVAEVADALGEKVVARVGVREACSCAE